MNAHKRKGEHVVIDAMKQAMVCGHCGTVAPITYGDVGASAAAMKAFGAAHNKCRPGDSPRTWLSVPTVPMTTADNRRVPPCA